jgi:MoxR-like ATPase
VLATQNPLEMEGTYPLPEAQIDRFFFKLLIPYPDKDDLSRIMDLTTGADDYETAASAVLANQETQTWWQEQTGNGAGDAGELVEEALNEAERQHLISMRQKRASYLRQVVRGVLIDPEAREYILKVVMATHEESIQRRHRWFGKDEEEEVGAKRYIEYGASPRGAQTLVLAAKVLTLLADRAIVTAEDVRSVVLPALRHRLILNFEAESEEKHSDDLLSQIMERISP